MERAGWAGVVVAVALLGAAVPAAARDAEPPPPELTAPSAAPVDEGELEALPPGEGRASLLLDLALLRHAAAVAAEAEERAACERAVSAWREAGPAGGPVPPLATPRGDALRAQALALAQRALADAPASPRAPQALLVTGLEADRLGLGRDATRALGALVRGHPASPLAADGWAALAQQYQRAGDLTRARAALEAAQRAQRPALRAWAAARLAAMGTVVRQQLAPARGGAEPTAAAARGAARPGALTRGR